jgi:galactofuranosylgalactofuranosylrhamnosyl-N-acetylglucosaminyl-diphospho-decaprenol beta-1,5/1,6-galactofuranosyltransferase
MSGNTPITEVEASAARANAGSGAARLTAQRGLFTGPSARVPSDLYLRVARGDALRERSRFVVNPYGAVDTNTYFGRFPACHWQRWTDVREVRVELVVSGSGQVSVLATDRNADARVVATQAADGARAAELTLAASIDRFTDAGALFVRVETGGDELAVESLRWTVTAPETPRTTSVVTCTYNRVSDVLDTMGALAADGDALGRLDAVYVVDQGSDVVEDDPRFAEVSRALSGKLHYIRQPNLGGAGGFSRGMYEVLGRDTAASEHANVLLMDDDVLLEPEIVVRMTAFADRTVQPTLVGGHMLKLLHPSHLLASAEWADMAEFVPGKVKENALDRADLLALTRKQTRDFERRVDADYNAWWSCLVPAEVVRAVGYPLPLFFQWDDIEFGYRAKQAGFPTATLPGAAVWHADFDWKDIDEWNRYFSIRNAMITGALRGDLDPVHTARVLLAQIVRNLLAMQYGLTATIIKAAEDFLDGPGVLHDGGTSVAAEVRKLRAEYPDTKLHPITDVPGYRPGELPQAQLPRSAPNVRLALLRRLADLLLGRAVHPIGTVAKADAHWWHVALFGTAVVTDSSQQGVRLRSRDRARMVSLFRHGARVLTRVVAETPAVKQRYRDAVGELTTRQNWARLYGIAGEGGSREQSKGH